MLGGTKIPLLGLILVAFGGTGVYGSVIKFEAYPAQLKNDLTSSASMCCSLADNAPNGGQIGKRQSLISTPDDILHIHDIKVTRNNGTGVAYLSTFDTAMAMADLGNLQVKGNLTGPSTEGYLQLTWKDPSTMVMGEYVCQVTTVKGRHHTAVVFTSTLEMTTVEPNIMDVVARNDELVAEIKADQARQISEVLNSMDELKKSIQLLKVQSAQQNTKLSTIQTSSKNFIDKTKCKAAAVAFSAGLKVDTTLKPDQAVAYNRIMSKIGDGYNGNTGIFTCQVPGMYTFNVEALTQWKKVADLHIYHNNLNVARLYVSAGQVYNSGSTSALINLRKGDTVQVKQGHHASYLHDGSHGPHNTFSGIRTPDLLQDCA